MEGPRGPKQQQETATTRDVAKTMWFPEWDWYMMAEAQDYIRGEQPRTTGRQAARQGRG